MPRPHVPTHPHRGRTMPRAWQDSTQIPGTAHRAEPMKRRGACRGDARASRPAHPPAPRLRLLPRGGRHRRQRGPARYPSSFPAEPLARRPDPWTFTHHVSRGKATHPVSEPAVTSGAYGRSHDSNCIHHRPAPNPLTAGRRTHELTPPRVEPKRDLTQVHSQVPDPTSSTEPRHHGSSRRRCAQSGRHAAAPSAPTPKQLTLVHVAGGEAAAS
jgi:hypothetical protein